MAIGIVMSRETMPATRAITSELRTAKAPDQNISTPLESVPRKFSIDGGKFLGKADHIDGSVGEKNEMEPYIINRQRMIKLHLNL
jgi:hypothetical protein